MCLKSTIDSTTNHLNLSPMFLNCLLLDLDKIWVEIAKNFEMRTSGGRGVHIDFGHPRTRGGGGVKKRQIFADVLYGWPLNKEDRVSKVCHRTAIKTLQVSKNGLSKDKFRVFKSTARDS